MGAAVAAATSAQAQEQPKDTLLQVNLKTVNVTAKRVWENDTVRYQYNQTKYYITTILPYLDEAVAMHQEMQARINNGELDRKDRKQYLKKKEAELKEKFDAEIKGLNETQGVLLVKLIARQTGENIYDMLLDYKSFFTATKWLGWAKLHGFNLNKTYDPNEEPMLESIMESLDYPLPAIYYNDALTAN